jgi:antitoxin component of MazEF toxin-antitoxin module
MFKVKVRKVGNSLGAILPSEVAARMHVKEGDSLP